MLTRKALSGEHLALLEEMEALSALLAAEAPDMARLGQLRWRMTRVLIQHVAKEDRLLYPRLSSAPDPEVRNLAQRFQRDMGGLADAYRDHIARWPASAIVADWPGYRRDAEAIAVTLAERIEREELELYPRLTAI